MQKLSALRQSMHRKLSTFISSNRFVHSSLRVVPALAFVLACLEYLQIRPLWPVYLLVIVLIVVVALLAGIAWSSSWLVNRLLNLHPAKPRGETEAILAAAVIMIAAFTVSNDLDNLLASFHMPGDPATSLSTATPFSPSPVKRAAYLCEAMHTWATFELEVVEHKTSNDCGWKLDEPNESSPNAKFSSQHPVVTLIASKLAVDTAILIPAYGAFLVLLVRQTHRQLDAVTDRASDDERTAIARFRTLGQWIIVCIMVAITADWIENGQTLTLAVASSSAYREAATGPLDCLPAHPTLCNSDVALFTFVSVVKTCALVMVVAYFVMLSVLLIYLETTAFRRDPGNSVYRRKRAHALIYDLDALARQPDFLARQRNFVQVLLAVRPQILIVVTFGAALLLHEQAWDVIRRWPQDLSVGFAGIVATLGLAYVVRASSCVMIRIRLSGADNEAPHWGWLLGTVVLVATIGVPHWGPTWKLAYLAAIIGGIWGLGLTFSRRSITRRDPQGRRLVLALGSEAVPRLLSSVILAILGTALLRVIAAPVLYSRLVGSTLPSIKGPGLPKIPGLVMLGMLAIFFFVCAIVNYSWKRLDKLTGPERWKPAQGLFGCTIAWWLIVWLLPMGDVVQWLAPMLGVLAILCLFLILFGLTMSCLILLADQWIGSSPHLFGAVGRPRLPVILLVVIWSNIGAMLPPASGLSSIPSIPRALPSSLPAGEDETLQDAFNLWRCQNGLLPTTAKKPAGVTECAGQSTKDAVPLVLVATTGGGIRAAFWTVLVLDRVLGYGPPWKGGSTPVNQSNAGNSQWIFAASGVSGGSLGLASYVAHLADPDSRQDPLLRPDLSKPSNTQGWIDDYLSQDNLAPSVAWMLFVEGPWSILHFGADKDRAKVFVDTLNRLAPDVDKEGARGLERGLFELRDEARQPGHRPVPLLLLNGTSVESGCRFNASVLKANGRRRDDPTSRCLSPLSSSTAEQTQAVPGGVVLAATNDLVDFLCEKRDRDISLSEAVLLSARFPLITAPGHLQQCEPAGYTGYRPETYVVDGGYLENSAAGTALELWSALEPLVEEHNLDTSHPMIVPFFLQISNGYNDPAAPSAVVSQPDVIVPITTVNQTRTARESTARQAAEMLFSKPFGNGTSCAVIAAKNQSTTTYSRYVSFTLTAHPGIQAPLGWTLSSESQSDLKDQFQRANTDGSSSPVPKPDSPLDYVTRWFTDLTRTSGPCPATPSVPSGAGAP